MNETVLEEAVAKTLQYFSLFHYPLTAEELFTYLWQSPSLDYSTFKIWLCGHTSRIWSESAGFYFLVGHEMDVDTRQRAVAPTEQKIRIAMRGARLLQWIPFLRGVYVCNSVAAGTAREGSDIDIFIVTENKRTWLVRFLVILTLDMFRMRLHGRHTNNRLCLSFFSDINHLNMERVVIAPDDIYLAYWLTQLVPVYDPQNRAQEIVALNTWMHRLVPNALKKNQQNKKTKNQSVVEGLLSGRVGDWVERVTKHIQYSHKQKLLSGKQFAAPSAVVMEDGFLKFHETDRRKEFREKWLQNSALSLRGAERRSNS